MARSKSPPPTSPDDLEAQFYEALQRGDLERLMAVWADDDEISCVHPGGPRLVGAAEIRASFLSLFAQGVVDARPEQIRRARTSACAVHSVLERVAVQSAEGARSICVVATNVFVESPDGWRLVAHHASHAGPGAAQDIVEVGSVLH